MISENIQHQGESDYKLDEISPLDDENEFQAIITILGNHSGIKFNYYKRTFLQDRINLWLKKENIDGKQLLSRIRQDPDEILALITFFSINCTSFFRNPEIFARIREIIETQERFHGINLKIWSSPCATGEEVYSIAMILEDIINTTNNKIKNYSITGSDINKIAIEHAINGIYQEKKLNEIPHNYQRYFDKKNDYLFFKEEIKQKLRFIHEDITQARSGIDKFDVIFCRNLLIYLSPEIGEKVLEIFDSQLKIGGLLVLGKTDCHSDIISSYIPIDVKNNIYVKKKPQEGKKTNIPHYSKLNKSKKTQNTQKTNYVQHSISQSKILLNKSTKESKKLLSKNLNAKTSPNLTYDNDKHREKKLPPKKSRKITETPMKFKELEKKEAEISSFLSLDSLETRMDELHARLIEKEHIFQKKMEKIESMISHLDILENELVKKQIAIQNEIKLLISEQSRISTHRSLEQQMKTVFNDLNPTASAFLEKYNYIDLNAGSRLFLSIMGNDSKIDAIAVKNLGMNIIIALLEKKSRQFAIFHLDLLNLFPQKTNDETINSITVPVKQFVLQFLDLIPSKNDSKGMIIGAAKELSATSDILKNAINVTQNILNHAGITKIIHFTGGLSKRDVLIELTNANVYVKKEWEKHFRKCTQKNKKQKY